MFITYNKVSSLGQKKVELFKRILGSSIGKNSKVTVDEIITKYTSEEEHYLMAKLEGNSVAGVIAYRHDATDGFIDYIAVAKKYSRNGYGRSLVNHVFDQNSVQRVTLECGVESATFFEKVGFKVTEQFTDLNNQKKFRFERKVDKQVYF
jgi:ribosomal protein S18 acetylase RimI-like enzyme